MNCKEKNYNMKKVAHAPLVRRENIRLIVELFQCTKEYDANGAKSEEK